MKMGAVAVALVRVWFSHTPNSHLHTMHSMQVGVQRVSAPSWVGRLGVSPKSPSAQGV